MRQRKFITQVAVLTTLFLGSAVRADEVVLTSPPPTRVVVLPFEVMSDEGTRTWVGRAVQQSLIADLARGENVRTTGEPPATRPVEEVNQPLLIDADFVVSGSVQLVGQDVRIVGQVVDVKSGSVVVSLKSTGPLRDLFSLEDTLAAQAKRALPAPKTVAPAPSPVAYTGPVRTPVNESTYLDSDLDRAVRVGTVNRPLAVEPTDAYRNYTYGQPYWGYPVYGGYPWYGYGYSSPIVIIRNDNCFRGPRVSADVNFGGDHYAGYIHVGGSNYGSLTPSSVVRGPNTVGYYPMTLQTRTR